MANTLQPFQQRVVKEYNELIIKLNGLNTYLETHTDENLQLQQEAMTRYAFILSVRIDEFTI
jgi:hypothetical protein